uniref:Uncharacterized protein n=1 Tax=Anguilla anguilla TaxID=7936 RepID=A0A0E9VET5_ANGAN
MEVMLSVAGFTAGQTDS